MLITRLKELLRQYGLVVAFLGVTLVLAIRYINPAPPRHVVIATGDGEGDYQAFANQYKEQMAENGVDLKLRATHGALENLELLLDPKSDVDVAFVQDGLLASDKAGNLVSLGSLYYEPLWIFYSDKIELPGHKDLTRLTQLKGKRLSIGEPGSGTSVLVQRLLKENDVTATNSKLNQMPWAEAEERLRQGTLDVAFLIAPPEDPMVARLIEDADLHLLSLDQAEAVTRRLPFLHHLVLPHGALDLPRNLPPTDLDLLAPTATLLAKDTIHPAVVNLMLQSASQIHGDPGILERKGEFPAHMDYEVPISSEAAHYYKNGIPFWQRYVPFWLATIIERLALVAVPFFALVLPALKSIPRFISWRARNKILARYGELKFLETQVQMGQDHSRYAAHLETLQQIEDRVNRLKLPIDFAEHVYGLRQHIDFVRDRLVKDQDLRT